MFEFSLLDGDAPLSEIPGGAIIVSTIVHIQSTLFRASLNRKAKF